MGQPWLTVCFCKGTCVLAQPRPPFPYFLWLSSPDRLSCPQSWCILLLYRTCLPTSLLSPHWFVCLFRECKCSTLVALSLSVGFHVCRSLCLGAYTLRTAVSFWCIGCLIVQETAFTFNVFFYVFKVFFYNYHMGRPFFGGGLVL